MTQLYRRAYPQISGRKRLGATSAGQTPEKMTATISAYETNAKSPSVDCLIEIAELLGVSLETLVFGENAELFSIHSLSQEQKELVTALTQYFSTESAKFKTAEHRLYLVTELVRLLSQ